ncbi:MAG TPA: CPBP family intramembrane glutamic endopeptidase [Thermoanaerobaculia bacterium]
MPVLQVLPPLTLFVAVHLAVFVGLGIFIDPQWAGLIAVICATAFTVGVVEGGRWRLGFFVSPQFAARDFLLGCVFAAALILASDALVIATSNLRQTFAGGFPRVELITVFIPAAFHEELAFRGYIFQKMRLWNRGGAIAITSAIFALMHSGNRGVTALAIANLVLAGVLLALAYERFERLWFPIGIHLAWNIFSGPVLGFDVSGYVSKATLFRTSGSGAEWITGGAFGIEGSIWMAIVELAGIVLLTTNVKCQMLNVE